MLINLELIGNDITDGCRFQNLGKVNVLCGRNNSGKSTILREIFKQHYKSGVDIPKKVFYKSCNNYLDNALIAGPVLGYIQERLFEYYIDIETKCWFLTEIYEMAHYIYIGATEYISTQYSDSHQKITLEEKVKECLQLIVNFFSGVYFENNNPQTNICYIPSKREIEVTKEIIPLEETSANGNGILNRLFFYKNQSNDSNQYIIYTKIKDHFRTITSGFDFDITVNMNNQLQLSFTNLNNKWITAEECGLGLQDLLIILYFANVGFTLVLIDEAETHLHPDMQRRLLAILKNETDSQFIISTHSNVFLDSSLVDRVYHVSFDTKVNVKDATTRSSILHDLGFSIADNLISDIVILCEGPTDKPVIEEFLVKMGLLEKYNIKIWPLGGDIMDQLDLSVFKDNYKIIALLDLDPGSRNVRERFKRRCNELGIPVKQLERYSIENYFSLEALKTVFGSQISDSISAIDQNVKLEEQIKLNPKKCNRRISKEMKLEDIKDTDLYDFLVEVKDMLEK